MTLHNSKQEESKINKFVILNYVILIVYKWNVLVKMQDELINHSK